MKFGDNVKPRIKKVMSSVWKCFGRGVQGIGGTPFGAYMSWAAEFSKLRREIARLRAVQ